MTQHGLQFESLEQMAVATARGMTEAAAHRAYGLFSDKGFRRLTLLEALSQTEQDRIFNELLVSGIVLVMLVLEAPDLRVPREFKEHLGRVKEAVPKAHIESLKNLGIEQEHLEVWEKLIALRYAEYAKDKHDVRAAAMRLEAKEKPLDLSDLANIQLGLPVQTVAIGCHHHICRGETDGRDELFKLVLGSLSKFYIEIRVPLEGGRITPLARARVALKRLVRGKRRGKRKL